MGVWAYARRPTPIRPYAHTSPLPPHLRILLHRPGPDGEDAVAAEHAPAGEEAAVLPVGEAELGAAEGILPVHPAGEAVADERGIHPLVEAAVPLGIFAHQAGDELRAPAVEEPHRLLQALHHLQGHFRRLFP